jgi:site-specific DNA-methyltransferase (adenine-specific)/adenine-specific DNA-methyltransferase
VKCIYIDPPYNTGNENWVYNDNVNSPEIRQWIKATVGKEGEDLSRHDKWLCMMYPRLALLRDFLTEDGAIFVSIDDVEVGHLRLVMDEIFGPRHFIANFVWQSKDTPGNNSSGVAETHNHVLAYKRSERFVPNLLGRNEKQLSTYTNQDNDPRGPWLGTPLTRAEHRDRDYYELKNPAGRKVFPPKGSSWRRPPAKMKELAIESRIWWGKDGNAEFPMEKKFLSEVKEGVVNQTWWPYQFAGSTRNASAEIKEIFDGQKVFDTPKPIELVKVIAAMSSDADSFILDSFAGSGTTPHAVLAMNHADGGSRRFITVEMDEAICRDVTAQRIRKAIEGYGDTPGLGGGFRFCRLGAGLFDDAGNIAGEVHFTDLAAHVFFTETGVPIPKRAKSDCPLLGVHHGKAVYLLFNGVLGDKRPAGGNVLTHSVAQDLPAHSAGKGPRVVYGEACRLGAKSLEQYGITFRQVPFVLKVD